MKVRNRFSKHVRFISPSPTGRSKIYEERMNKDGVLSLVQTGEHNVNDFVQASLESTKIYNILDRFEMTGDVSLLNSMKGFYADVTGFPSTLAEAHNLMLGIEKKFSELSPALKEKFNNSSTRFANEVISGNLGSIIAEFVQSTGKAVAEKDPSDSKETGGDE